MFACMTAFQVALGLAARGGRPFEHEGLVAAIVPGLPDLALANAAVYRDAAGLARALPLLERAYEDAGVRRSLIWVPPNDQRAYEALRAAGYAADSEAPAMALDLALLPAEDDPPDDWTDSPDPAEIAHIVERSYGLADGAIGAAIRGWLEPATTFVARLDGRPACCLTMIREGPTRASSSWAPSPRRAGAASRGACCCMPCTARVAPARRSRRCSRAVSATRSTGGSATSSCAGSACGSAVAERMLIGVLAALAAATLYAVGVALQSLDARQSHSEDVLRPGAPARTGATSPLVARRHHLVPRLAVAGLRARAGPARGGAARARLQPRRAARDRAQAHARSRHPLGRRRRARDHRRRGRPRRRRAGARGDSTGRVRSCWSPCWASCRHCP